MMRQVYPLTVCSWLPHDVKHHSHTFPTYRQHHTDSDFSNSYLQGWVAQHDCQSWRRYPPTHLPREKPSPYLQQPPAAIPDHLSYPRLNDCQANKRKKPGLLHQKTDSSGEVHFIPNFITFRGTDWQRSYNSGLDSSRTNAKAHKNNCCTP